jgi:sugar phosphate isomerase/epimerase
MNISRRTLLQSMLTAAAAQTASQVNSLLAQNTPAFSASEPKFAVFSKHFVGLPYNRLAEVVASCGANGIEAPIRPGGHIEPAKAREELPKLAEALKKNGLEITQLTSALTDASPQSHAESLLRTAKALGIERYRLGFFKYDLGKPLWPQLDEIKARLKDLVAMSKEIGILPCFQNHSGAGYVGAAIWDVALMMRDFPTDQLAWSFDIMHATIEGNLSWPAEVALVKERIGIAYFKNFIWDNKRPQPAPLGEGIIGKPYVDMLRRNGYSGPVSLHVEYLRAKPTDSEGLATLVEATKRDMEILKSWWE